MRGGGCAATKREGRTPFVALLTTLWGFWCWGGGGRCDEEPLLLG